MLGLILLAFGYNSAFSPVQAKTVELPIVDVLDLIVDGSGAGGVNVSVVKSFDVISRLVTHMEFLDNAVDFSGFGSGTALVNGLRLVVNFSNTESSFLNGDTINSNNELGHVGFDILRLSDDRNPKGQVILSRLSFDKFSPVGIDNRTGLLSEFFVQVQDDLTDGNVTHLEVSVEGYQIITSSFFIFPLNDFKPNFVYQLELEDLRFGVDYNLKVNTSELTGASMWINFTARDSDEKIKFTWDIGNYDASTVNFYLYEGNNFLQQQSTFVTYNDITTGTNSIIQFSLIVGVLFITIILAFFMIDKGKMAFKGKLR